MDTQKPAPSKSTQKPKKEAPKPVKLCENGDVGRMADYGFCDCNADKSWCEFVYWSEFDDKSKGWRRAMPGKAPAAKPASVPATPPKLCENGNPLNMGGYGFCDCNEDKSWCNFVYWSQFDDPSKGWRRNMGDCESGDEDEYGFCDCDDYTGQCNYLYWDEFDGSFTAQRRSMKGDLKRKVHLHGRRVDCYADKSYEDEWGYCDCWDDLIGNEVCGYWEYCEHDDPATCYMRPKSTLPKKRNLALDPDCVKLGPTFENAIGYCECGASGSENTCWWETF